MDPIRHGAMSSWNVWPNGIECGRSRRGAPSSSSPLLGWAGRKHAGLFVAVKGLSSRLLVGPAPQPFFPQPPGPPFDDVPHSSE